jgi:hypothetical protein
MQKNLTVATCSYKQQGHQRLAVMPLDDNQQAVYKNACETALFLQYIHVTNQQHNHNTVHVSLSRAEHTCGLLVWMRAMICGITTSQVSMLTRPKPSCSAASTSGAEPHVNHSVSNRRMSCKLPVRSPAAWPSATLQQQQQQQQQQQERKRRRLSVVMDL